MTAMATRIADPAADLPEHSQNRLPRDSHQVYRRRPPDLSRWLVPPARQARSQARQCRDGPHGQLPGRARTVMPDEPNAVPPQLSPLQQSLISVTAAVAELERQRQADVSTIDELTQQVVELKARVSVYADRLDSQARLRASDIQTLDDLHQEVVELRARVANYEDVIAELRDGQVRVQTPDEEKVP